MRKLQKVLTFANAGYICIYLFFLQDKTCVSSLLIPVLNILVDSLECPPHSRDLIDMLSSKKRSKNIDDARLTPKTFVANDSLTFHLITIDDAKAVECSGGERLSYLRKGCSFCSSRDKRTSDARIKA